MKFKKKEKKNDDYDHDRDDVVELCLHTWSDIVFHISFFL